MNQGACGGGGLGMRGEKKWRSCFTKFMPLGRWTGRGSIGGWVGGTGGVLVPEWQVVVAEAGKARGRKGVKGECV